MDNISILETTDFQEVVKLINKELKDKKIYNCEYLLINNDIEDVMNIIEEQSDYYNIVKDDQYSNEIPFKYLIEKYFVLVKKYYDDLMINEGKSDNVADKYMNKMKENTRDYYPKTNINMVPIDVDKTLRLMKEAVQVYYKVYDNKELIAELSSSDPNKSEYFYFEIKIQNLLHLLGVTSTQLVNNPDFQRLTGTKRMGSVELLEWILKDIDGNNDLLQYQEDFIKKVEKTQKYNILRQQYNQDTSTQLLNYYKVRAKSEAFLKYGPFENVSLVAKLAPNKKLSQYSNSNTAMITKAETFRKYPWAYFGSVQTDDNRYIETLIIDSNESKKEIFKGSKPAIVKGVYPASGDDSSGGGNIFNTEEQFDLFCQAYDAFKYTMDFSELIQYFKNLCDSIGPKIK